MPTLDEINAFTRTLTREQCRFLIQSYAGFPVSDEADDDIVSLQDSLAGLLKAGALRSNARDAIFGKEVR